MISLTTLVLILVVVLLCILAEFEWSPPRTYWHLRKVHGPRVLPLIGLAFQVARTAEEDLIDYLGNFFSNFERYFYIMYMGVPHLFIKEPEDLEAVMGNVQHIKKGKEYVPLDPWLKEGLLLSTGSKWHTRRKLLTPAFHFRILEDSLQTMNKNSLLLAEKMLQAKEDDAVDVGSFIKLCTLDVICESVMGVPLGAQINQGKEYVRSISRISELLIRRITYFWMYKPWMFYLNPTGFEFRKVLRFLHKFTDQVIADRKRTFSLNKMYPKATSGKIRMAFLDTMIEHESKHPGSFSEADIREEVDTFMFEGHDTTASALVFMMFLLGSHMDVQDRVYEELYEIFGDSRRSVDMKDLAKMTYLEMVIKETLRLFPSVPYISRYLTADLKLEDGTMIPAGANMAIMPYFVHRNPRFYPEPERFDPERFAEEAIAKRHPFAYIPFSAGPRNCIGQKFAMMELKVTLSTVLRKAKLESVTKREEIKLLPNLILRPNVPIKIKITARI